MRNNKLVEAGAISPASDSYTDQREFLYASIEDQLDAMYWDTINGTTVWSDYITSLKETFPKPEE